MEKAAQAKGETPLELADRVMKRFQALWEKLNVSNTDFIRTSQERHKKGVHHLFEKIQATGDIYLGEYEDWYCTPCETFWTETQLMDGCCPDCGRPTDKLKEESYFFRMSKYQEALVRRITSYNVCYTKLLRDLAQQLLAQFRRLVDVHAQRLKAVRRAALGGGGAVAVFGNLDAARRRDQRGRGGDIEALRAVSAGSDDVHHLHVVLHLQRVRAHRRRAAR